MNYWIKWILLFMMVLSLGAGCQSPASYSPPMDGPDPSHGNADLIRVGDALIIRFTDIPNPPEPVQQRVREDGRITLQFQQDVVAADKTVSELEALIEKQYVPDYYKRLTVFVSLEKQYFTVMGEVKAPGNRPWLGETTVLGAIAASGDFTDFANKRRVILTRSRDKQQVIVDCNKALRDRSMDLKVYPGDSIHVPRRFL